MQSSYSGQQASRYPDASTANIEGLASKIGAHTSYIPDILCRQKPNLKSNPHQFHHVGGAAIRSGSRGPSTASTRPSGNGQPAERPKSADYRRLLLAELNQELISASTSELKEVINYLRNRGRSIIHSREMTGSYDHSSEFGGPNYYSTMQSNGCDTISDLLQSSAYESSITHQEPLIVDHVPSLGQAIQSNASMDIGSWPPDVELAFMPMNRESLQTVATSTNSSMFDSEASSKHSTNTTLDSRHSHVYTRPASEASTLESPANFKMPKNVPKRPWKCTYGCPPENFGRKYEWQRHERNHDPQELHTCHLDMVDFPNIRCPAESCNAFMDQRHLDTVHKASSCKDDMFAKTERFEDTRLDKLRDHLRTWHKLDLKTIPKEWSCECEAKPGGWNCGFCGQNLKTWKDRADHLSDHFRAGFTMDHWSERLVLQGEMDPDEEDFDEERVTRRVSAMSLEQEDLRRLGEVDEGSAPLTNNTSGSNFGTAPHAMDVDLHSPDYLDFQLTHVRARKRLQ